MSDKDNLINLKLFILLRKQNLSNQLLALPTDFGWGFTTLKLDTPKNRTCLTMQSCPFLPVVTSDC